MVPEAVLRAVGEERRSAPEDVWEDELRRLEGIGAALESERAGEAYFAVDGSWARFTVLSVVMPFNALSVAVRFPRMSNVRIDGGRSASSARNVPDWDCTLTFFLSPRTPNPSTTALWFSKRLYFRRRCPSIASMKYTDASSGLIA